VTDRGIVEQLESSARKYSRGWPTVFVTAKGSTLVDEEGRIYLDFFAGAGALNYGHNHPRLKEALLDYLARDQIVHTMDMLSTARERFLERLAEVILEPRGLAYKVQFSGPSGTEAVEAALKLCRKVTGRRRVLSFAHAFHGMTLGSLSVSANWGGRWDRYLCCDRDSATRLPFGRHNADGSPDLAALARLTDGNGSEPDKPAAVIVETVQGEGGLHAASAEWLRALADCCTRNQVLLIVDDVQMGCGRTGPFFSFEPAGIVPDVICLSKSLSGYGLPLGVVLYRPELDVWMPGEHTSTFRGFAPAFVTAAAALDLWAAGGLAEKTMARGQLVETALRQIAAEHADVTTGLRGRGLARGIAWAVPGLASEVCAAAFRRGLLMETCGPNGSVTKLMPPVTTTAEELSAGMRIVAESVRAARNDPASRDARVGASPAVRDGRP
jgi:diaminobutyrate-2-oxoglutarate transaminase